LSTKGGLVWQKYRNAISEHGLTDTVRGAGIALDSSTTGAQASKSWIDSFTSTGFVAGAYTGTATQVAWTFRKQAKFFDIVTWTGDGTNNRAISHNLGSNPGCILIKSTSNTSNWNVYHSSIPTDVLFLELTDAATAGGVYYVQSTSSTTFTIGRPGGGNVNGYTYVAYLFASNAGGFGSAGTDNVITCGSGSWSGGADNVVNLGYEAQWVMYKRTDDIGNWMMFDVMRGMSYSTAEYLRANLSSAAGTYSSPYAIYPNATGFTVPAGLVSTGTYIYIAIRRGPMATPTTGTSVFSPISSSASTDTAQTTNFPVDMQWVRCYKR